MMCLANRWQRLTGECEQDQHLIQLQEREGPPGCHPRQAESCPASTTDWNHLAHLQLPSCRGISLLPDIAHSENAFLLATRRENLAVCCITVWWKPQVRPFHVSAWMDRVGSRQLQGYRTAEHVKSKKSNFKGKWEGRLCIPQVKILGKIWYLHALGYCVEPAFPHRGAMGSPLTYKLAWMRITMQEVLLQWKQLLLALETSCRWNWKKETKPVIFICTKHWVVTIHSTGVGY